MREWYSDLIHAVRRLRAAPTFTLFSVVTLGLGIGATTAIYSVVYAAVLRPPDIPAVERVANLYHSDPRGGSPGASTLALSRPDFEDYRRIQTSFEHLAAWKRFRLPLIANGRAEVVMGEAVSGDFFNVVGISPALGRLIQPADDRPDAPRVIVLSDGTWRRFFAADPGVVGRTLKVGTETYEVVGVTPASFRGVDMPNVMPTPAWIPLGAAPLSHPAELSDRESRSTWVKGRLKNGRSIEEAASEFRSIGRQLDQSHPIGTTIPQRYRRPSDTSRQWFLMPMADVKMHESVDAIARPLVGTIMIAVGLVLLVACTNIANLMLARGTARRQETAVRLALGASRWRLIREHLVEAALVTAAGTTVAFVVARLVMQRLLSGQIRLMPGVSVHVLPEMNASVALVTLASTALALVVFGLIPALHASRGDVREAMAADGQNAALPRWRGRRGLIACQVAVSAGLVSVAVLCAQQLIAIARHDTGFDHERLAILNVNVNMRGYDEVQGRRALDEILEASRRLPGVEQASLSSGFPIEIATVSGYVGLAPDRLGGVYNFMISTPSVFDTWGVRMLQGRGFDERDTPASPPVAVLTERLARSLFPEGTAVGRQVLVKRAAFVGQPEPATLGVTVVGVAADTDVGARGNRGGGLLYMPWTQHYSAQMTVTLRTGGDPAALVDPLRRVVTRLEPDLPILEASSAASLGDGRTIVVRVGAAAAGLLGGLAFALAMAGLYGVLSELVLRRTRELGIRMALGADARRLLRMVIADGTRPVAVGLAIGLGGGVILRLAFRPLFLRMMPAFDPVIVTVVPMAFLIAAAVAAYLPALRASRVDPNVALRHL